MQKGVWHLGSMYADKMLNKGVEFIGNQVVEYLRSSINDVTPRMY